MVFSSVDAWSCLPASLQMPRLISCFCRFPLDHPSSSGKGSRVGQPVSSRMKLESSMGFLTAWGKCPLAKGIPKSAGRLKSSDCQPGGADIFAIAPLVLVRVGKILSFQAGIGSIPTSERVPCGMAVSKFEGAPNPCSKRLICCFKCDANNSPKALFIRRLK